MADAITVTSRPIYIEDFYPGSATFAQTTDTILGIGPGVTVTPLVIAANDTAALAAGCPPGCVYINNGGSFPKLSSVAQAQGAAVTSISPGSLTGAVILAGGTGVTLSQVGQTITISRTTGSEVTSISPGSLTGAVTFAGGTGVTLSQVGQTITINSSLGVNITPTALVGTIDGINATFTITPTVNTGAAIFKNGVMQDPATMYTLVGQGVTFNPTFIPQSGDYLQALVS